MSLARLNPHIRFAMHFPDLKYPRERRCCYDCRLFFIIDGEGLLESEGRRYEFRRGTALFVPPGSCYRFLPVGKEKTMNLLVYNFDLVCDYAQLTQSLMTVLPEEFCPEMVPQYPLPEEFSKIFTQELPALYEGLKKVTELYLHQSSYYRERSSAILKGALLELLQEKQQASDWPLFAQVTEYIHREYADPALSNQQIAEVFGYHPYHLSRLMKEHCGKSLHQYLLSYRLQRAKTFLLTTDWDINTLAWKCGFNSASYFISQFRNYAGMTPLQFRRCRTEQRI